MPDASRRDALVEFAAEALNRDSREQAGYEPDEQIPEGPDGEDRRLAAVVVDALLATDGLASRFSRFDEPELRALWDALTVDDGVRYDLAALVHLAEEFSLAREIRGEARRRGIDLPDVGAGDA